MWPVMWKYLAGGLLKILGLLLSKEGIVSYLVQNRLRKMEAEKLKAEQLLKQANVQAEEAQLQLERMQVDLATMRVMHSTKFGHHLELTCRQIWKNTKANRIVLVKCTNGKTAMDNLSVVFEKNRDERTEGAMEIHFHRTPDDRHRSRIKMMEEIGRVIIDTGRDVLPTEFLAACYRDERNVPTHSVMVRIARKEYKPGLDVVLYAVICTIDPGAFSPGEIEYLHSKFEVVRAMANTEIKLVPL